MDLLRATQHLVVEVGKLRFGRPVAYVYNPLQYAGKGYRLYLERYGVTPREVVLLGMNPGPWGMAQTGVPFGEVRAVRDWLGIEAPVGKPPGEHPRRPVLGFACPRSEVSGARLWGWASDTFVTPGRFFARFFVANYCPLAFLEASGRNRTPDKLPAAERQALFEPCDRHLRRTVEYLRPRYLIGIGTFAENRARAALADYDLTIGRIPHPSPASPSANTGWAAAITKKLKGFGIVVS